VIGRFQDVMNFDKRKPTVSGRLMAPIAYDKNSRAISRPRSEIKAKEEEKWALVATPHIKKQYTEMAEAVKSALEIAALHRYST